MNEKAASEEEHGKMIARGAVDTLKRVTLELGGKSPNLILDDANFDKATPLALRTAIAVRRVMQAHGCSFQSIV